MLLAPTLLYIATFFFRKLSKAKRRFLRLATSGDGFGAVSFARDTDRQVLVGSLSTFDHKLPSSYIATCVAIMIYAFCSFADNEESDSEDEEPLKL